MEKITAREVEEGIEQLLASGDRSRGQGPFADQRGEDPERTIPGRDPENP